VPRILLEKKVQAAKTPKELLQAKQNLQSYLGYRKAIHNKVNG
jgi:hypothetical protein